MLTIERIIKYLEVKDIKLAQAERECGFSNGLLGNAFRTKTTIGGDKIEKILNRYNDLSAEWLLRGTGTMLIGEGIPPEQLFRTLHMPPNSDKIIEVWMKFMDCTQGMQELYRQANNTESVQKTCDYADMQSHGTNNE